MPIPEELTTMVKEISKEDKQPLTKNGPILKWSPGNIILDEQDNKEYFEKLIHDLNHQLNDENGRNYVPDDYDEDDGSLG